MLFFQTKLQHDALISLTRFINFIRDSLSRIVIEKVVLTLIMYSGGGGIVLLPDANFIAVMFLTNPKDVNGKQGVDYPISEVPVGRG